jgi:hypothetical protein
MRDASGWSTDEPMPTKATAMSTIKKLPACDSMTSPAVEKHMPKGRHHDSGCLSNTRPTTG